MRTEIGCVALLLAAMGCVTSAAASENATGVAGKRGLSPINHGWDDLPISNGTDTQKEAIRKALFGDGTASGSLIKSVVLGDATTDKTKLERMGDVLRALGVPPNGGISYNLDGHYNHFHLNIKPPTNAPVAIVASSNLLVAESTMTDASPLILAAAPLAPQVKFDAVYSICTNVVPVGHGDFSGANGINLIGAPVAYFEAQGIDFNLSEPLKLTLLNSPKHGEILPRPEYPSHYMYHPNEDYLGSDQMTYSVEVKGKILKVIYSVHVDSNSEYVPPGCGGGYDIKELPNPTKGGGKGSSLDIIELPTDGFASDEELAKLHSLLSFALGSEYSANGGSLNIADLPNGAIGQTTGLNITLDTNAAGYNWFINNRGQTTFSAK